MFCPPESTLYMSQASGQCFNAHKLRKTNGRDQHHRGQINKIEPNDFKLDTVSTLKFSE